MKLTLTKFGSLDFDGLSGEVLELVL